MDDDDIRRDVMEGLEVSRMSLHGGSFILVPSEFLRSRGLRCGIVTLRLITFASRV